MSLSQSFILNKCLALYRCVHSKIYEGFTVKCLPVIIRVEHTHNGLQRLAPRARRLLSVDFAVSFMLVTQQQNDGIDGVANHRRRPALRSL